VLVTGIIGQSISCVSYLDIWGRGLIILDTGIIGAEN